MYARKVGHSIPAILRPDVWTSTNAIRFTDHPESVETMPSVKMFPVVIPVNVHLDLLVTRSGCASIWTNVRNQMRVEKELFATTSPDLLTARVRKERSPIQILGFVV